MKMYPYEKFLKHFSVIELLSNLDGEMHRIRYFIEHKDNYTSECMNPVMSRIDDVLKRLREIEDERKVREDTEKAISDDIPS